MLVVFLLAQEAAEVGSGGGLAGRQETEVQGKREDLELLEGGWDGG
jgi:hypothetical protein